MIDGLNNHKHVASSPDGTTPAGVVSSSDVNMSGASFTGTTATAAGGGTNNAPNTTAGANSLNGEEVTQLKKNMQDLQVIADEREKNISEVSRGW